MMYSIYEDGDGLPTLGDLLNGLAEENLKLDLKLDDKEIEITGLGEKLDDLELQNRQLKFLCDSNRDINKEKDEQLEKQDKKIKELLKKNHELTQKIDDIHFAVYRKTDLYVEDILEEVMELRQMGLVGGGWDYHE